jgi:hypothetical protein
MSPAVTSSNSSSTARCPICTRKTSECFCEQCRCGREGSLNCYIEHSLRVADADLDVLITDAVERYDCVEVDLVRALIELKARRAAQAAAQLSDPPAPLSLA